MKKRDGGTWEGGNAGEFNNYVLIHGVVDEYVPPGAGTYLGSAAAFPVPLAGWFREAWRRCKNNIVVGILVVRNIYVG